MSTEVRQNNWDAASEEKLARGLRTLWLVGVAALASACSRSVSRPSDPGPESAPRELPESARAAGTEKRNPSAELAQLRRFLDHGDLDRAAPLLSIASQAGAEAPLLAARAAALSNRSIDALRLIETARANHPRDPEVYATAAEIYAATDSFESAWKEVQRGESACGESPELLRAKGILWIARQGGAEKGLSLLEQALAADPTLPFVERALGQAHLLVAKQAVKANKLESALTHVRASLHFDPQEIDARRFLSETLAACGDFTGSIEVLEELCAQGEPLGSELALMQKRAGIAALLAHQRERALACFVAAREHGLTDRELASGARILAEEAQERVQAGVSAYEAGELDLAEQRFREALHFDPGALQAENHLAVVLFRKQALPEAITLWKRVLETARTEQLELPEPVHINLAKAEYQFGDLESARLTLEEYLDREPFGEWVEKTRDLLELLPKTPGAH